MYVASEYYIFTLHNTHKRARIRCAIVFVLHSEYHLDAEAAGHVAAAFELLLRLEHRLDELSVLLALCVRSGAHPADSGAFEGAEARVETGAERQRCRRHDELGVLVLLLLLRAADALRGPERALLAFDHDAAPAAGHAGRRLRGTRARRTRGPHREPAASAARRSAHVTNN